MLKRFLPLLFLIALAASLWALDHYYPTPLLHKAFVTAVAVAMIHLLFKHLFQELLIGRITVSKTRYSFRKTVSILYIIVVVAVVMNIWIENTQSLLVSYGIIAAGLAVALQDLFKNFFGGIVIFVTGIYKVGDRVEINSRMGDVIDIDILYTTLMEMGEWMSGDQSTGRLTMIPNGYILSRSVNNYTKDHPFLWDEISLPITYDSDWKEAVTRILAVVRSETEKVGGEARESITNMDGKYYLPRRLVEPAVFITLTDNWINFDIRYVTMVRERRLTKSRLSRLILEEIERSENIKLASTTIDIVGFPEVRLGDQRDGPGEDRL
jgi:small-conductance mechanosensitive channel